MKDALKFVDAWLRDAHAMEGKAITFLEAQISMLDGKYPEVVKRLRSRLIEIWDHRFELDRCRRKLGEFKPAVDMVAINVQTNLPDFSHWLSGDELLQHVLAHNTVEQIKAETYRSLSAAAQAAGAPEIARICDGILMKGSEMKDWMWEQLPHLTRERLLAV
jgi:ferritin-like metal-binding protein YciE